MGCRRLREETVPKGFNPQKPSDDKKSTRDKRKLGAKSKPVKKDRTVFRVTERATPHPKGETAVPRKLRREHEREVAKTPEGKAVKVKVARRRLITNAAIAAVSVILIAVIFYFYSYKPNVSAMPGQNVGPVVAKINGLAVHEQNIKVMKGYLTSQRSAAGDTTAVTDKEAFEDFKKQIVQYQEARRRGLAPKQSAVDAYVNQNRKQLDEIFVSDPATKTDFLAEIAKMSLSELDYWSSLYPTIARQQAIGKLQSKVLADFRPNPPLGGTELQDAQKKYYDDFVSGLVKKAKVQILADSLK